MKDVVEVYSVSLDNNQRKVRNKTLARSQQLNQNSTAPQVSRTQTKRVHVLAKIVSRKRTTQVQMTMKRDRENRRLRL